MDNHTSEVNDTLIVKASIALSELLSKKLGREITTSEVRKELFGIKYGVLSDNIPFNVEVYNALRENDINILYQENTTAPEVKTFKNNPNGNRIRTFSMWD